MDWTDIAALIMAVGGLLTALAAWFKGRHAEKASAAKSISEAAGILVDKYEIKIARLEDKTEKQQALIEAQQRQIDHQQEEIDKMKHDFLRGVRALCEQIRSLGKTPVWEPVWNPDTCDWDFVWRGGELDQEG